MADKKTVGAVSAAVGGVMGFIAASLSGIPTSPPKPAPSPAIAHYAVVGKAPTVRHSSFLRVDLPNCYQQVILAASDAIDVTRHGCLLRVRGDYAGKATIHIAAIDSKGREIGDGYYEAEIKP